MEPAGLFVIVVIAMATAAISMTVSKAHIFAFARKWVMAKHQWFGRLVSCPYCTSHWVAIMFVAIYRPTPIRSWIGIDLFVSVFTVVAIATFICAIVMKLTPFREDSYEIPNNPPSSVHSGSNSIFEEAAAPSRLS